MATRALLDTELSGAHVSARLEDELKLRRTRADHSRPFPSQIQDECVGTEDDILQSQIADTEPSIPKGKKPQTLVC